MSTSVDPGAAALWRAARGPLAVALVVLAAAAGLALLSGGAGSGRLDPRSPQPSGGRAVAQVLGDLGVRVELRTTTAGVERAVGAGTGRSTVLVVDPGLLVEEQVRRLAATGADLVVVGPPEPAWFAPAVTAGTDSAVELRRPGCRLGPARRAGSAHAGGGGFVVAAGADAALCYARDGVPSLVRIREDGRAVTVLGSATALTNSRFGDEGNAALVLGLLGSTEHLVWYLPSLADIPASAQRTSFYDLVPDGVWWGLTQLAVAVLVLGLWRARRLGPVVVEPLPVVVRAAETVEGRARLYRRAGARDAAADSLRAATRARLVTALGLPAAARPEAVVDAVAARARRTPPEVTALLYGAAPPDDRALVRLADELDALDREARRP